MMDGQGNSDGLAISPGDTIRLKVPKDFGQEEALYFKGPEEWYQEKEFTVAVVNLLICVAVVLYSGREVLRENIIDEIRK